ncbi:hypothetical protein KC360_g7647 [Hortaea werneckii]|nr:hypothetical protein KC325_g7626 [Hortaea werneckii]KAI6988022.1 hypothetical protein KC359_g7979 [Hortaea werneckii]KAI7141907.1 hypothetical protein KC344_g7638 [Hortaea werneckii]KAI7169185.1 hypothetical protein KC360_g7647 [Hortaea werneckii]
MHPFSPVLLAAIASAAPWGNSHWQHTGPPDAGEHSYGHHAPHHFGVPFGQHGGGLTSAAYFLDNNPNGSAIIALTVGPDGLLKDPVRTSTGGYGAISVNPDGSPRPVDTLSSQGTVTVKGNMLFTINAGSNTVVMFRIDPEDPTHLTMVGSPASTMGEVPVSVDYSDELHTACVLNGGSKPGVSCFYADPWNGLVPQGSLRSLGYDFNQTTPPTAPAGTASQVIFDPNSTALFAILKGYPGQPAIPGSVVAYRAEYGSVSEEPVRTQISDIIVDFGSVFLDESRLFMTDVSFGAAILDVDYETLTLHEETHIVIEGQKAICWSAFDPYLNTAYAPDAGQPVVYTVDAISGMLTGSIAADNRTQGLFDSAIGDRGLMYSLAASNGLNVLDLKAQKNVQYFDLSSVGERMPFTGLALWPN